MNQNQPLKLLLDECLGRPVVEELNRWLSRDVPAPTIHHLTNYFVPGTKDPDWIPKIKNEGWIILTQDRGKKGKDKLPTICSHYRITHILMGKSVAQLKQFSKANAIVSAWEQIKECKNAPPGTRFRMILSQSGRPIIEQVN